MTFKPQERNRWRVDLDLSAKAQKLVNAQRGACFRNSILARESLRSLGIETWYVEGWAVMVDLPIVGMHGWLETLDGKIIECTSHSWSAYYPVSRRKPTIKQIIRRRTLPWTNFMILKGRVRAQYNAAHVHECGVDFEGVISALHKLTDLTKRMSEAGAVEPR